MENDESTVSIVTEADTINDEDLSEVPLDAQQTSHSPLNSDNDSSRTVSGRLF